MYKILASNVDLRAEANLGFILERNEKKYRLKKKKKQKKILLCRERSLKLGANRNLYLSYRPNLPLPFCRTYTNGFKEVRAQTQLFCFKNRV